MNHEDNPTEWPFDPSRGPSKTKLTRERSRRLYDAVRLGASYADAALYAGLAVRTLYSWLERGERGDEPWFRDLWYLLQRAKGEQVVVDLANIERAGKRDWKASAWRLERRNPEAYSMRYQVSFTHEGDPQLDGTEGDTQLTPEELDELKKDPEVQAALRLIATKQRQIMRRRSKKAIDVTPEHARNKPLPR